MILGHRTVDIAGKVPYIMDMANRYMAIAHTWNNGDIEYVNVLDNASIRTMDLEGDQAPQWLKERVAMLRMCDINHDPKGEVIGRKFTNNMQYVYLTYDEYQELKSQIGVQK
jgi:hypothetical protein